MLRRLALPARLCWSPQIGASACQARCSRSTQADDEQASTSYYTTPVRDVLDGRGVAERRLTSRLLTALEQAVVGDAVISEVLVQRHGFAVHRVRLSGDRRTMHILWDAHPGAAEACGAELQRSAWRLRATMAKIAKTRFTPRLEFRHDRLPTGAAATASALERVEAAAAAGASQLPPDHDAALQAAIEQLQQATAPKPWHTDKPGWRGD
jgi:ribosome-binding factor A